MELYDTRIALSKDKRMLERAITDAEDLLWVLAGSEMMTRLSGRHFTPQILLAKPNIMGEGGCDNLESDV
jgi:hypothetical protein